MQKKTLAAALFAFALVFVGFEVVYRAIRNEVGPEPAPSAASAEPAHPSLLYGRITTMAGDGYEGRLRWGQNQEAFWTDCFNGVKDENPWAVLTPPDRLVRPSRVEVFGVEVGNRDEPIGLGRQLMTRFGDVARIERRGNDVLVTLKSGTVFRTDFNSFSDFDDGVRVWDLKKGPRDLGSSEIRAIEFLPAPAGAAPLHRLHGTVRTTAGAFTGFVGWNRDTGLGADTLYGANDDGSGAVSLPFEKIRSIAKRTSDSTTVTLDDGREIAVTGTRDAGNGNTCLYVDNARFGRVLICWHAFERVDFSPGPAGPSYADFPEGAALSGSVATRDGRRIAGRIVYDLDESETTETFDAPLNGVQYNIPFGLVASIVLPTAADGDRRAGVKLWTGEELRLELGGDLGDGNAGLLVFAEGAPRPEHVRWADVERVDFSRPAAMYPPLGGRAASPPRTN